MPVRARRDDPVMTSDDFITKLREMNTGAPMHVVVADAQGRYWEPALVPSRIRVSGEPPYVDDDDRPFAFVIVADQPRAHDD